MIKIEERADGVHICGYVNTTGKPSRPIITPRGKVIEVIEERAFEQALRSNGEVTVSVDHDQSHIYEGIGDKKKWVRLKTYGAKLVENITQSVARDLLLHSMAAMKDMDIIGHVHDEVIVECNPDTSVEQVCHLMEQTPEWAEGLLLRADGYECEFYNGNRTAGIDGILWNEPEEKFQAIKTLKHRGYKHKPLKRMFIKKSNGQLRPLGIPTIKDRAMQTLYKLCRLLAQIIQS